MYVMLCWIYVICHILLVCLSNYMSFNGPLPFLASATVSWILWPLTWLVCQFSVSFLAGAHSLIVHTLNVLNIFLSYIDTIQNNLQMSQALYRTILSSVSWSWFILLAKNIILCFVKLPCIAALKMASRGSRYASSNRPQTWTFLEPSRNLKNLAGTTDNENCASY